jgi:hypothetical protein
MRKTYAAPSIIKNGDVIRETLSNKPSLPETASTGNGSASRIGFSL